MSAPSFQSRHSRRLFLIQPNVEQKLDCLRRRVSFPKEQLKLASPHVGERKKLRNAFGNPKDASISGTFCDWSQHTKEWYQWMPLTPYWLLAYCLVVPLAVRTVQYSMCKIAEQRSSRPQPHPWYQQICSSRTACSAIDLGEGRGYLRKESGQGLASR